MSSWQTIQIRLTSHARTKIPQQNACQSGAFTWHTNKARDEWVGAAKSPAYLTIYQQSKCGIAWQHQLERYQGTHWLAGILNKVLSTMPRSASTEKQHWERLRLSHATWRQVLRSVNYANIFLKKQLVLQASAFCHTVALAWEWRSGIFTCLIAEAKLLLLKWKSGLAHYCRKTGKALLFLTQGLAATLPMESQSLQPDVLVWHNGSIMHFPHIHF